jgi:predicted phage terminase large subunit-like protein
MLHIVPSDEQVIHREWIQTYDVIPPRKKLWKDEPYTTNMVVRIGVDLAISERDTADYTAMVPGMLYETLDGYDIYILPKIINRRLTFPETVETCKTLNETYTVEGELPPVFVIEDVAYQRSLPQQLKDEGIYDVNTVRPGNQDKRTRLVLTANMIKRGKVKFPKEGAEELINQIVNFGVEKHDDLADAFSNLVLNTIEEPPRVPRIF